MNSATSFMGDNGATIIGNNTKCSMNFGFKTENSGYATVTTGNTFVTVNHGLSITPKAVAISVTPSSDLSTASKFWVSDVTPTSFKINLNTSPSSSVSFGWHVVSSV